LFKIHSQRAAKVKPDKKKNIEEDDQWELSMKAVITVIDRNIFTSEKLTSLFFMMFEVLLFCCPNDDSGYGARGGDISGCEEGLPG
jgi:hypothetical protein